MQNNKKEEVIPDGNTLYKKLIHPNFINTRNFSSNFTVIGLLASAICISLLQYISVDSLIDGSTFEIKNNIDDYTDNEEKNIANTDADFDYDEESEDEEELPINEDITTSADGLITLGRGDTLAKVLERVGINKSDIHDVSVAISHIFRLQKLKPGQEILVKTDNNDKTSIKSLEFKPDKKFKIIAEKINKRFIAKKEIIPLKRVVKKISGTILPKDPASSLKQCGLPKHVTNDALKALKHITNISKSKIGFNLAYEQHNTEEGELINSNLLAITTTVNGKTKKIYKFSVDGIMQYVDANGTILSSKKSGAMFIKPISYGKITSHFGYRYHPISGRSKLHTGIDLSASIGTPVRATASGGVVMAQHYGGYGQYVKIKHLENYNTAYAHLSRYVVKPGQRVKQGQIIGYSGNSGYSTGAHLHYEVMYKGKFVNPLAFVPKPPRKFFGKELTKFNAFKRSVNI